MDQHHAPSFSSSDPRERVLHACAAATRSRTRIAAQYEIGASPLHRSPHQERVEGRTARSRSGDYERHRRSK
jgi:hypothetical protein